MPHKIGQDRARFRKIVKGHIRDNLKKYIHQQNLHGKQGKDIVRIPMPQIELPRFRFGKNEGGVGQGEGNEGDPLEPGEKIGGLPGSEHKEYEKIIENFAKLTVS